jgi:hypothetical protein
MDAVFVEHGGYYRIPYVGVRTYSGMVGLIDKMVANAEQTGVFKCLFDLRQSEEGFTMLEKYDLGTYLANVFGSRFTVAVLIRPEHITGFLENVSINRGAVKFLITSDEDKARRHMGEHL